MRVQVLLVSMNRSVRDALADWFRTVLPDCCVRHASGARDAVAQGQEDLPDLVVIQESGSDVSCFETIRAIAASAFGAPMIVLTDKDYAGHRDRLIEAGASACILPWRINPDLVEAIERLNVAKVTAWT